MKNSAIKETRNRLQNPRLDAAGDGWLRRHGPGAALILTAVAVFGPALRAGFVWDDTVWTESPLLRSWHGLWDTWFNPALNPRERHYWPMVYTTFWLEHRLWGFHPFGYHLVNVLLHGVCGVLVWRVLRRLGVPGAWLGAALFVVHPVHVESVAWVIERKDVLSGALGLGAALSYLRFEENRSNRTDRTYGTYFLALVLFTLALLSKSIVVTLPVALGLVIWWKRGRLGWRDAAPLAVMLLLAAAVAAGDMAFYRAGRGSAGPAVDLSLVERAQMAGRAFWVYLGKLAWPHPLVTFYPKWTVRAGSPALWLPAAAVAALFIVLWMLRRRIGRGPLAAMTIYLVVLGPVLGLVDFAFLRLSWVADRFQYLASIGPIALAAAAIKCGIPRIYSSFQVRKPGGPSILNFAFIALLLGLCGVLTWRQAARYHDSVTLFRHNATIYPGNWVARYHHGVVLSEADRLQEAAAELGEALRLKPAGDHRIYHDLAVAQGRLGLTEAAEGNFKAALAINPRYAEGWNNFGAFLASRGRLEDAIIKYREALQLRADYPEALNNLGNALARLGRAAEAEASLREAVRLSPGSAEMHTNLASALAAQNKFDAAIAQYQEALQLNPDYTIAHINLGLALLAQGKPAEAAGQLGEAVRRQPRSAALRFQLAEAFRAAGRIKDAAAQYGETLRLNPKHAEAAKWKAACERELGANPR